MTGAKAKARGAAGGVLCLFALLIPSMPASAAPYDYGYIGNEVRFPDDAEHRHCWLYYDIEHGYLASAMDQLDIQTVMYRYDDLNSCPNYTDAVWVKEPEPYQIGAGEGYLGQSPCIRHVSWGVCDQHWVRIDQEQIFIRAAQWGSQAATAYSVNIQLIMRHELGHTAGLHHATVSPGQPSNYGAMNSVEMEPTSTLIYLTYRPEHIDDIAEYLT